MRESRTPRPPAKLAFALLLLALVAPERAHAFGAMNPLNWFRKSSPKAPPSGTPPASCSATAQELNALLYRGILFREPDYPSAGSWCSWVSQGFNGFVLAARGIVMSSEFQQKIMPRRTRAEIIGQFYNAFLNRPVDSSGYATWVASTRFSYAFVLNEVLTSGDEFESRYWALAGGTPVPTPTPTPPGNPAPAELDLHQAVLERMAPGFADWPITTRITRIELRNSGVHVEMDGGKPNVWPDFTPPGWDGPLLWSLGIAEKIDGVWHASAPIQFWRGLDAFGGPIQAQDIGDGRAQIPANWFYDGRWGAMNGYRVRPGEQLGIFVCAGDCRDGNPALSPVKERSNVVLINLPQPDQFPVFSF